MNPVSVCYSGCFPRRGAADLEGKVDAIPVPRVADARPAGQIPPSTLSLSGSSAKLLAPS